MERDKNEWRTRRSRIDLFECKRKGKRKENDKVRKRDLSWNAQQKLE